MHALVAVVLRPRKPHLAGHFAATLLAFSVRLDPRGPERRCIFNFFVFSGHFESVSPTDNRRGLESPLVVVGPLELERKVRSIFRMAP